MRIPLLSVVLLFGLSGGAVPVVPRVPERRVVPVAASGALAELQRAVGNLGTVTAASATGSKSQEAAFSKAVATATETATGVRVLLPNGKAVPLKNVRVKGDETSDVTYSYRGSEPQTGLVWVKKSPYECPTQLVVSRQSGRVTDIGNEPHLNAPGTLLFARQNGCFMVFEEYRPGFQLWRVQAGQLQLLKSAWLTNYFVLNGYWVAPNKLRLELGRIADYSGVDEKVRRLPFELTLKP